MPPTASLGRSPSPLLSPTAHPAAAHPSFRLAYPRLEDMIEDDEPSDPPETWVHIDVAQDVVAVGVRLRHTPLLLVAVYDWRKGVCLGVSLRLFDQVGYPRETHRLEKREVLLLALTLWIVERPEPHHYSRTSGVLLGRPRQACCCSSCRDA
jgi:hypothetical protein